MSEEKKTSLNGIETMLEDEREQESIFSFQNLFAMFILNWQYFLLSLFIFVCGALIYLRYTTPVYEVQAKVLIKDEQRNRYSRNSMLSNMQELGFMNNSEGINNEIEIIKSTYPALDAVMHLKLYTEYRTEGRVTNQLVYKYQPISVDVDEKSLMNWDEDLLNSTKSLQVKITRKNDVYDVIITPLINGKEGTVIKETVKSLPASVKTPIGIVTLSVNPLAAKKNNKMNEGAAMYVTIVPPTIAARRYVAQLSVEPSSKMTSIAILTVRNPNVLRALDFIKELVHCYNAQANDDKNEIALKTEEFINARLEKIDAELGTTESALEKYKRNNAVTQLNMDAGQSLQMSGQYDSRLAEANSQIELLKYLREYVDNPNNRYKIIPSNVGMTDAASLALIASYNQTVQERNRLLTSASEQAPQVLTLTSTLDDLQTSIRAALLQAKRSADILRQGIQSQYAKYKERVGSTPEQERVLNQIGRQQEVKSGLYLLLLQKREENSISLAATADKGKMIDEPRIVGKVSPKNAIILMAAVVLGLALPMIILYIIQLLSYRLEGHDDLVKLTTLPIVADVPVASDSVKTSAGIVVQANKNNQIDEIFRSMRTNIQFMMKEGEKVILFTSSTAGEGKTFLAANLAVSFALLGKKVVLCGLDIRKPALGRLFSISDRQRGTTALLVKQSVTKADVESQIIPSGVNDNLDLLLAGSTPPNPTELLARPSLNSIMEILKEKYDYVILDTAPVGLVTDTLQIARYTNVSCYVCRADYTPKANVGLLNDLSEQKKLPNPCVILNGVDMSKRKYGYYYGYGKYGKYGRYGYGRYGYGKYGYGRYGYGNYGNYGNYAQSHYGNKDDDSIKK